MYERMLDKTIAPNLADLTAWCREAALLFTTLNEWIAAQHATDQKIVFPYGNRYGWGVAHRKKAKLICNVFAERGALTVMTHLSNRQFERVYPQLSEHAQTLVDNKYPCGDGGWIHFRVTNQTALADIQALLDAKMNR